MVPAAASGAAADPGASGNSDQIDRSTVDVDRISGCFSGSCAGADHRALLAAFDEQIALLEGDRSVGFTDIVGAVAADSGRLVLFIDIQVIIRVRSADGQFRPRTNMEHGVACGTAGCAKIQDTGPVKEKLISLSGEIEHGLISRNLVDIQIPDRQIGPGLCCVHAQVAVFAGILDPLSDQSDRFGRTDSDHPCRAGCDLILTTCCDRIAAGHCLRIICKHGLCGRE